MKRIKTESNHINPQASKPVRKSSCKKSSLSQQGPSSNIDPCESILKSLNSCLDAFQSSEESEGPPELEQSVQIEEVVSVVQEEEQQFSVSSIHEMLAEMNYKFPFSYEQQQICKKFGFRIRSMHWSKPYKKKHKKPYKKHFKKSYTKPKVSSAPPISASELESELSTSDSPYIFMNFRLVPFLAMKI